MTRGRRLAALVAAAIALPAPAYVPPPHAVLKRLAQKREEAALHAFEVRGTLSFSGDAAVAAAAAAGLPLAGGDLSVPAVLSAKTPGRCRLELVGPAAPASAPAVVVRRGKLSGARGLDHVHAAAALAAGVCALLGERPTGGEPDRVYAEALSRAGVPVGEVTFGRLGTRVAYVIGARPTEAKPQAWIDKRSFQPVRIVAPVGGALADVRLLDWGSPTGGDWFPRAVEVWDGKALQARFTTEKVTANPRLPDSLF